MVSCFSYEGPNNPKTYEFSDIEPNIEPDIEPNSEPNYDADPYSGIRTYN